MISLENEKKERNSRATKEKSQDKAKIKSLGT